jgi:hypothetical protein
VRIVNRSPSNDWSKLGRLLTLPLWLLISSAHLIAGHPHAAPGVTTLTNPRVKYKVPTEHFVVLRRGPITAVVADNAAGESEVLPKHQKRYNGIAALRHEAQPRNLFVPNYAGLNLEHYHDGTNRVNANRFEPRDAAMELRVIDRQTVELYQPPTPTFRIESCGRYHLLNDGTIEYTFECIPRSDDFSQGFLGVFWASYIDDPADPAIHFRGTSLDNSNAQPASPRPSGPGDRKPASNDAAQWLTVLSRRHGENATHPPAGAIPDLKFDEDFPLLLINHRSPYVHTADWYYGICRGMAYVQMFRPKDRIWFAQSPTGGGASNPAWDFQWFVLQPKQGDAYGLVMRAAYVEFKDQRTLVHALRDHLQAMRQK